MPRTKEQFNEMKDKRVQAILDAALPLFALYDNKVSIDAICKKAKCSHGLVYHYFKNTDEIYNFILTNDEYRNLNFKLIENLEGSSYEKIEFIVNELLNLKVTDTQKASYFYMLIKENSKNSLFATLKTLIKEAQQSRLVIGGEPQDIVNAIFTLLKGIYFSILFEKHPQLTIPSPETVMQFIRKPTTF